MRNYEQLIEYAERLEVEAIAIEHPEIKLILLDRARQEREKAREMIIEDIEARR